MRLFIAIPLPPDIRRRLMAVQNSAEKIRWIPENQLHLTLKFIGELDNKQTGKLARSLKKVPIRPLELQLTGPGRFPKSGRPRVLWIGVSRPVELISLQKRVSVIVEEAGAEKGRYSEYKPHITMARVKHITEREAERVLEPANMVVNIPFAADRFILYESILESSGVIHRALAEYSDP